MNGCSVEIVEIIHVDRDRLLRMIFGNQLWLPWRSRHQFHEGSPCFGVARLFLSGFQVLLDVCDPYDLSRLEGVTPKRTNQDALCRFLVCEITVPEIAFDSLAAGVRVASQGVV